MSPFSSELRRLREEDPDVAPLLDVFQDLQFVYRDSLEAMGLLARPTVEVSNSADIAAPLTPWYSTSGD